MGENNENAMRCEMRKVSPALSLYVSAQLVNQVALVTSDLVANFLLSTKFRSRNPYYHFTPGSISMHIYLRTSIGKGCSTAVYISTNPYRPFGENKSATDDEVAKFPLMN